MSLNNRIDRKLLEFKIDIHKLENRARATGKLVSTDRDRRTKFDIIYEKKLKEKEEKLTQNNNKTELRNYLFFYEKTLLEYLYLYIDHCIQIKNSNKKSDYTIEDSIEDLEREKVKVKEAINNYNKLFSDENKENLEGIDDINLENVDDIKKELLLHKKRIFNSPIIGIDLKVLKNDKLYKIAGELNEAIEREESRLIGILSFLNPIFVFIEGYASANHEKKNTKVTAQKRTLENFEKERKLFCESGFTIKSYTERLNNLLDKDNKTHKKKLALSYFIFYDAQKQREKLKIKSRRQASFKAYTGLLLGVLGVVSIATGWGAGIGISLALIGVSTYLYAAIRQKTIGFQTQPKTDYKVENYEEETAVLINDFDNHIKEELKKQETEEETKDNKKEKSLQRLSISNKNEIQDKKNTRISKKELLIQKKFKIKKVIKEIINNNKQIEYKLELNKILKILLNTKKLNKSFIKEQINNSEVLPDELKRKLKKEFSKLSSKPPYNYINSKNNRVNGNSRRKQKSLPS